MGGTGLPIVTQLKSSCSSSIPKCHPSSTYSQKVGKLTASGVDDKCLLECSMTVYYYNVVKIEKNDNVLQRSSGLDIAKDCNLQVGNTVLISENVANVDTKSSYSKENNLLGKNNYSGNKRHDSKENGNLRCTNTNNKIKSKVLESRTITTIAEVHLEVSYLSKAYNHSLGNSKTSAMSRVPLFATTETVESEQHGLKHAENYEHHDKERNAQVHYSWSDVSADVVFSPDGNQLACLIPRPVRCTKIRGEKNYRGPARKTVEQKKPNPFIKAPGLSTILVFTLKKKRVRNGYWKSSNLPIPSYISSSLNIESQETFATSNENSFKNGQVPFEVIPTPSDPRVVTLGTLSSVSDNLNSNATTLMHNVTSLCSIIVPAAFPNSSTGSLLLAGCDNGAILVVGFKFARLIGVLYHPVTSSSCGGINKTNPKGIHNMVYHPPTCDTNSENIGTGRLISIQRDGGVIFYSISFTQLLEIDINNESSNSSNGLSASQYSNNQNTSNKILMKESLLVKNSYTEKKNRDGSYTNFVVNKTKDAASLENKCIKNDENKEFFIPIPNSTIQNSLGSGICEIKLSLLPQQLCSTILCDDSSSFLEKLPVFIQASFIEYSIIALLVHPVHPRWVDRNYDEFGRRKKVVDMSCDIVAQVWHVSESSTVKPKLMADLKMNAEKLLEVKHGIFDSVNQSGADRKQCNADKKISPAYIPEYIELTSSGLMISCDSKTKCIGITGMVLSNTLSNSIGINQFRTFISVWDWRNSVLGLTLANKNLLSIDLTSVSRHNTFSSNLYFCEDNFNGCSIVHSFRDVTGTRKFCYEVGVLSPSEVERKESMCTLEVANPLMTSPFSIYFPFMLSPGANKESTLHWKETRVAAAYAPSCGSIRVASIGKKFGRSVAIAGQLGLCILDLSDIKEGTKIKSSGERKPTCCNTGFKCTRDSLGFGKPFKWRVFHSELDERSFEVKAMTWWERNRSDNTSGDLLVAIIQYKYNVIRSRREKLNECQYHLVCWSRRRLGMGSHQLIKNLDEKDGYNSEAVGVALPKGLVPHSLSLCAEPKGAFESVTKSRSAAFVSSLEEGVVTYFTFQMQIVSKDSENQDEESVLTRLSSSGKIPIYSISSFLSQSSLSVCGIFIASASFQFNFEEGKYSKLSHHDFIATICVICNYGEAIFAVNINPYGPVACSLLSDCIPSTSISLGKMNILQKFWIADIITDMSSKNYFVWSFATSAGVFSWSLPFFTKNQQRITIDKVDNSSKHYSPCRDRVSTHEVRAVSILCEFQLNRHCIEPTGTISPDLLGNVCFMGSCIKGSATSDNEICVGPLPFFSCSCVFYAGQWSRMAKSQSYTDCTSAQSGMNLFGISDCVIGPPSFTLSIFLFISKLTSLQFAPSEKSSAQVMTQDAALALNSLIRKKMRYDSTLMSLRVIVMYIIECFHSVSKQQSEVTENISLKNEYISSFIKGLLSNTVVIAQSAMSSIQFTSLILNIGRQLELHQFDVLFPLKLPNIVTKLELHDDFFLSHSSRKVSHSKSMIRMTTVSDLCSIAVAAGSVLVASSALPLLTKKKLTYKQCIQLLYHCITTLFNFDMKENNGNLLLVQEECAFMYQLFRYGLKLENSNNLDNEEKISGSDNLESGTDDLEVMDEIGFDFSIKTRALNSLVDETNILEIKNTDGFVGTPSPSFASILKARFFGSDATEIDDDERAISNAASSFILSGYSNNPMLVKNVAGLEKSIEVNKTSTDQSTTVLSNLNNMNTFHDISGKEDVVSSSIQSTVSIKNGVILRNSCSVAGTIGRALISETFPHLFTSPNLSIQRLGWTKVAVLAVSLQNDIQSPLSSSTIQSAKESIFNLSILDLNQISKMSMDNTISYQELIKSFLTNSVCFWNTEEAFAIYEVLLCILGRNEYSSDIKMMLTPLALMTIASSHVCGELSVLIDYDKDSELKKVYEDWKKDELKT